MSDKQTQTATDALELDVSASDATLNRVARGFWVGTAGALEIVTVEGSTVVIPNANNLVPIQGIKVLNANTTATGIVALF